MTTLTPQTNRPAASSGRTSLSAASGSSDARSFRTGADYSGSAAATMPGFGAGSVPPARVLPSVAMTGPGQADWKADLLRFLGIGALGTVAYLALFVFLRAGLSAQTANIAALVTTSVVTIWAHGRLTAGNARRQRIEGVLALGVALVLTTGSLMAAGILTTPTLVTEVGILVLANLPASLLRFVLLTHRRLEQSAS